jgi:hypothetical protein
MLLAKLNNSSTLLIMQYINSVFLRPSDLEALLYLIRLSAGPSICTAIASTAVLQKMATIDSINSIDTSWEGGTFSWLVTSVSEIAIKGMVYTVDGWLA